MRILLDSHILLWSVSEPDKLSKEVKGILEQDQYPIFISIASLWEIAIKVRIGKISLPENFFSNILNSNVTLLNITIPHIETYLKLPLLHRDPFDRMLIAQARTEQLMLITNDEQMKQYNVDIL